MEDSKLNTELDNELEKAENEIVATDLYEAEVEEILEKLDPNEQKIIATMFSGPLPPPEILEGYTRIYPEAPEKLFKWVDEQQEHRHFIEKEQLNKDYRYMTVGIVSELIIACLLIIGGVVLILNDKEVYGIIGVASPFLLPLISMFINRRITHKNNQEKNEFELKSEENKS